MSNISMYISLSVIIYSIPQHHAHLLEVNHKCRLFSSHKLASHGTEYPILMDGTNQNFINYRLVRRVINRRDETSKDATYQSHPLLLLLLVQNFQCGKGKQSTQPELEVSTRIEYLTKI